MTNSAALIASINYPIDADKIEKLLIDNGISPSGEYAGLTKEFELATAGLYCLLLATANIKEGGYEVSMTDKSNMIMLASAIYEKYGLDNPLKPQPKITDKSSIW